MGNKDLYSSICRDQPGIPLFMQPWWLDAVCRKWDAAIAHNGDKVSGIWAYPVERKAGVSLIRNPLLTPYLGPVVFYPDDMKDGNRESYEHETITNLLQQLPASDVWHLALSPGMKQAGLFKNKGLLPQVQQTFLLDLHQEEEALLANMKDNTRRNIRNAEKDIVVSNSPDNIGELLRFQKATLEGRGKTVPYTVTFLSKLMDACLRNNAATLWVAKKGESIEAIVWQVWDEHRSYYLMGGQNQESGSYKAMPLLLWRAIKAAKGRGNTVFDFEGSMDEGVERFFRSFGGRKTLYMVLHKNDSLLWKLKQMVTGR